MKVNTSRYLDTVCFGTNKGSEEREFDRWDIRMLRFYDSVE